MSSLASDPRLHLLRSSVAGVAILLSSCVSAGCAADNLDSAPRPDHRIGAGRVLRMTPSMDEVIPHTATIEKLVTGFEFIEGPVWVDGDDPHLAFSDLRGNAIYRWSPSGDIRAVRDPWTAPQGAPNGLALDAQGRLVVCDQGGRRIAALEPGGEPTTIVDRYEGQRFNSPNDLVIGSDGAVYFTDPSHGLSGEDASPNKELAFNGVFRLGRDGSLDVVSRTQSQPNGIAFSPDETILYVSDSDVARPALYSHRVLPDGALGAGELMFDFAAAGREGVPDGVKVDSRGNVLVAGDGGIWVLSPEGRHLGTIELDERPAGMAWGDGGSSLYITAERGLYRLRMNRRNVPAPASNEPIGGD